MPRLLRSRPRRAAVIKDYVPGLRSVPARSELFPNPQLVAVTIGAGRVVLGTAFLAAPALSIRILGLDTATAKRVRFLARMLAARDIGLGGGTLAACPGRSAAPWLLAGAGADAVDALAIAAAVKQGTARGPVAIAVAAGAAGAAALGAWAALGLRHD